VGVSKVGIIWYRREEDYVRLKGMYSDGDVLPDTFAEWLKTAKNTFDTLTLEGLDCVKVYIRGEAFRAWCKRKGFEMDSRARARYCSELARRLP
jgi:hypothetical protein